MMNDDGVEPVGGFEDDPPNLYPNEISHYKNLRVMPQVRAPVEKWNLTVGRWTDEEHTAPVMLGRMTIYLPKGASLPDTLGALYRDQWIHQWGHEVTGPTRLWVDAKLELTIEPERPYLGPPPNRA